MKQTKTPPQDAPSHEDALDRLIETLDHRGVFTPDFEHVWTKLLATMRAESRRDPANFGRRMLDEAIAFAGYLALRGRHCTAGRHADWDRSRRAQGRGGPDLVLDDRDLPRLLELERHLADLLDARASVERKWTLARRNGDTQPAPATGSSESKPCPEAEPPAEPSHSGTVWGRFDA